MLAKCRLELKIVSAEFSSLATLITTKKAARKNLAVFCLVFGGHSTSIKQYSHTTRNLVVKWRLEIFFGSKSNDSGLISISVTSTLTTNTLHLSLGYYCYTKERGELIYSIRFIYMFAHSVIIAIQKSGESSFYSIAFIYTFAHSIFLGVK